MIRITLLGTAATMPLPQRALTSVYLSCNGHSILFDCGEGTQSAARKAGVSLMKCEIIALTHFHGDHIFGLPGLLQSMSCLGRVDPLLIVGPSGIEQALENVMKLAGELAYDVTVREMKDDIVIFPEAVLSSFATKHRCESVGYVFTLSRPGKFLPEKAEELGIDKHDWGKLQHGETVGNITPDMVLGEERKGLKFCFSGDTMPCEELSKAAKDADLFICEATFPDDKSEQAVKYGHMTVSLACEAGKNSRKTVLTHFSQMIEDPAEFVLPANIYAGVDGEQYELDFDER